MSVEEDESTLWADSRVLDNGPRSGRRDDHGWGWGTDGQRDVYACPYHMGGRTEEVTTHLEPRGSSAEESRPSKLQGPTRRVIPLLHWPPVGRVCGPKGPGRREGTPGTGRQVVPSSGPTLVPHCPYPEV